MARKKRASGGESGDKVDVQVELDLFSQPLRKAPAEPKKPEAQVRVWSVIELTRSVKKLLEGELGDVWVRGEISNFRRQASGHCYFGLKDEQSVLSCVLFRSNVPARLPLADGMLVQALGRVTVFEQRGQYQLNVTLVQLAGEGVLQARFEALKRKLEGEGLFDPARKKPIPGDPVSIGLVTSPTGAAIQDFLNIARRRAPWVRIVLNPVRVQGTGAAEEIAAAIREFNLPAIAHEIDLIIVCRGGGSIEDLWAFNEEVVARAIAASELPVISAVGHEIDFTIADFVADLRAPTPSAAAELALPDRAALALHLARAQSRIARAMESELQHRRRELAALARSEIFRFPQRLLQEPAQRLDNATARIQGIAERSLRAHRDRLAAVVGRVRQHRPDQVIAMHRYGLAAAQVRIASGMRNGLARKAATVERLSGLLRVLSPTATLARGYSITTDTAGIPIKTVASVKSGQKIRTRLADGTVDSTTV